VILTPRDITGELNVLYSFGATPGDSTGWKSLDELYTIKPGQVTVVTGWPGSGKSEWLDCLLVNLAKFEWRIACYSPENWPVAEHVSKVIEKWIGKPFSVGPTDRMGYDEVLAATEAIEQFGPEVARRRLAHTASSEVLHQHYIAKRISAPEVAATDHLAGIVLGQLRVVRAVG